MNLPANIPSAEVIPEATEADYAELAASWEDYEYLEEAWRPDLRASAALARRVKALEAENQKLRGIINSGARRR